MTRASIKSNRLFEALDASEDGHFAIEIVKNTLLFCVIGGAALMIQLFVDWLQEKGGRDTLVLILTWLEYLVLVADAVWFVARLYVGTFRVLMRAKSDLLEIRKAGLLHDARHARSARGGGAK